MDGRTLAIAANVVTCGLTLLAILLWLRGKMFPGFGRWTLGRTLAFFATLLGIQTGVWPGWLVIPTRTVVGLCDLMLILEACREFLGMRVRVRWNYFAAACALLVAVYVGVIMHSVRAYHVTMDLVAGVFCFACAGTLFRAPVSRRQVGLSITGFSFCGWAVAYTVRAGFYLFHPGGTLVESDSTNTTYLLFLIVWLIGTNFGFFLMNYERLLTDREQAAAQTERANDELTRLKESLEETVATRTAQLTENECRLEEAQQMAHLGSYIGNGCSREMGWSNELYRICEIDPALGAPLFDVVLARTHPGDRAFIQQTVNNLLNNDEGADFEHRLVMPDGRMKYVHVRANASSVVDGRRLIRGTVQDITERKRAEEERDKLQTQLARAQKMESIGRLAGGVAHDFNNMLTVILGYAAMSKTLISPDTRLWKNLTEIGKAANRSKEITQKLLAFSRQQIIAPVPSNLNDVVADLQEPLGRLIGEDIELVFYPGADLWKVMADHSQINQILLNLVVNARDAMPGGGKLTIETENVNISKEYCRSQLGAALGPHVRLAVSDTGVGMDGETLSHIFEPFFTTKDREKGTGLGLATVYGIVKQNGGFVNVYSEPKHGTTFKIYFPQLAGEADATEVGKIVHAVPAGHGTILLVEDDELVREMTKDTLESIGYTPLVAASPQHAIELCSTAGSDIRLMLTDVVMPGMNGMELWERVRALNPGIRALFMSGYTSNVIVNQGVLKQGVHFIQKPFAVEDLGRRLEEVLAFDQSETLR